MSGVVGKSRDATQTVGRSLQALAKSLCSGVELSSDGPEAFVEAQLALMLEHLDRQRLLKRTLLDQLMAAECILDSLVLPDDARYRPPNPLLESWVRDRLLVIGAERRQIVAEHERRVADLETRVLHLVSQRLVLGGTDAER